MLRLCPPETRVGAWVRPVTHQRGTRRARCGWEPVLFFRGRPRPPEAPLLLDWLYAPLADWQAYPGGLVGMKPPEFSWWMFDCLGAQAGDELVDLFPGSGAVTRAWERYQLTALAGERDASRGDLDGLEQRPVAASSSEIAAAARRRRDPSPRATVTRDASLVAAAPGDASPASTERSRTDVDRRHVPGQLTVDDVLADAA